MNEETTILDQVQQAQKPSELSVIASKINQGLEAFEKRKADLISLKSECENLNIESVEDKQNIALVSNYRKKLKGERVTIEKEGKSMRDPLTQISRTISEKENELILIIEPTEKLLAGKEKWVKDEQARIDLEKAQAEEKVKKEKVQSRIDRLAPYAATIDIIYLETLPDDHFEQVVANAKTQFEISQVRIAEEKRVADEAASQLKKDQEELAKLRDQQAEAQRIIDQENERIAKEQKAKEVAIAEEKERVENEIRALERHKQKIEVDKQREIQLEAARKQAAENERLRLIEEQKQKAIAEEEKLNQSTDKNKFKVVAATLVSIKIPAMTSKKAMKLHEEVRGMIDRIVEYINKNI